MRSYVLNLNGDRLSDLFWHDPATGSWVVAIKDSVTVDDSSAKFAYVRGQWSAGWDPHPLRLNDDDFVDLLLFNAASGEWSWALNDGRGGFTFPARGRWLGATEVHPGDFNGDGRWDAFLYDTRTGAWSQAINTGADFTHRTGTWTPALDIAVGDLDADGDADLFLYDVSNGGWSSIISEGTGDAGGRLAQGATGSWRPLWEVSSADFNTDGRLDFFLYYREAGTWLRALNSGSGTFTLIEGAWDPGRIALTSQSLIQGSLPNDAAREPCTLEGELRDGGRQGGTPRSGSSTSRQNRD